MGKVILVASGKGGTGKTMFSVNIGALLSKCGARVLLIDMDMGLRNMDLYLGMENKVVYNFMDVISGVCRVKKAMIKVKGFDTLYFMAASPKRADHDLTELHMKVVCEKLRKVFDYIIIDCPSGMGQLFDISAAAADEAVLVTEPEIAALRDADVTERYLMKKGVFNIAIIINKLKPEMVNSGFIPDLDTIASMLKHDIAGIIQYDENINISTNVGIPIICKSGTYIEKNFIGIMKRIFE